MNDEQLKPCPFCGYKNPGMMDNEDGVEEFSPTSFWVYCRKEECWCEGPIGESRKAAIEAWNTRHK